MACILHIETATSVCSVALSVDGEVVFERVSYEGLSHAALLGVFAEEAIAVAHGAGYQPDAVALSGGPGSYTGLRIGASMAKGLCMGWGTPLIAVETLRLMASQAIRHVEKSIDLHNITDKELASQSICHREKSDILYCAMLDARRMEVYSAIYDATLTPVRATAAEILTPQSYQAELERGPVCFFGSGAAKCQSLLPAANAIFIDNIHPLASAMVPLAEQSFGNQQFADTAYFEPFYLKEFMATVPKKSVVFSR
ncbi:MAG: tRNA (adenosine(37)-N6)-threonylcarbamoyltransferase complex dimerization subunit type 1 TsaB [Tannerella sp.]|jgi:tRNA threonylcarbamoyladenosine biosynthesis protein TsaB|nr:tRNA (adenosine(37)-N6)-threonylcarbamoyltransferase complex dimerization subunit type 1 TsaB [Tannerella sp.]